MAVKATYVERPEYIQSSSDYDEISKFRRQLLKWWHEEDIKILLTGVRRLFKLRSYDVDVPGAKAPKIDRLHLNSATFKAMRKV